jgi:Holliday junction resolvasome RuvABC endonuclease subunit
VTYPKHTRILALDLATVLGWSLLGGGVVTSGSQSFARYGGSKSRPADHHGEPFAQFHRWLAAKLRDDKPDAIAYEEVCRWQGYSAAHCFGGYRGHMMALAAGHQLPCFGYSPTEIKKYWTGKGMCDKDAMIAATLIRFPGIDLTDSNEADSLAILHLHLERCPVQA